MKTINFNSISEIADALEANEITMLQAIEITEAGLKRPFIVIVDREGKPNGTPETVIKNLREFDKQIKNNESKILIINLSN